MNPIAKHNLERMIGNKAGDMHRLLAGESIGGNAGSWKRLPCQGANFFYSRWDGKIVCFNNPQYVADDIKKNYVTGTLKVALNLRLGKIRIIEVFYAKETSEEAEHNIAEAVEAYNKLYGFEIV